MFTFSFDSTSGTRAVARRVGRSAWAFAALLGALFVCEGAPAQVITYEGTAFPEDLGWHLPAGPPQAQRRLEDGWLIETFPEFAQDYYRFDIGGMTSLAGRFFVEWRAATDNPSWLLYDWQVPTVVSAAGRGAAIYHTTFADSEAWLWRDNFIPIVIASVLPSTPHVYRVELYGAKSFLWYIDGVVVDGGEPQGAYPYDSAFLIWGAERTYDGAPPATAAWDYVRLGRIPDDASGDYNSDGAATLFDYYFVEDCLTKDGPGIFGGPEENAGPGCRFADFDNDSDVDILDFAEFQNAFSGTHP